MSNRADGTVTPWRQALLYAAARNGIVPMNRAA
jgi:hypothetical protein